MGGLISATQANEIGVVLLKLYRVAATGQRRFSSSCNGTTQPTDGGSAQ